MDKRIELTDIDGHPLVVAIQYITIAMVAMNDHKPCGTYLELSSGRAITVRESLADVLNLIDHVAAGDSIRDAATMHALSGV